MKIILLFIILIGFILFRLSGCVGECRNTPGSKEYRELVSTIAPSNSVAVKKFSEFPVDEQITIFLYARNCPDDPRIRGFFILDGEKKIPAIVERIKKEEKLWDKGELAGVLIPINTQCKCITRDSDVIITLEAVGKGLDEDKTISDEDTYKNIYKRNVEALKHQLDAN